MVGRRVDLGSLVGGVEQGFVAEHLGGELIEEDREHEAGEHADDGGGAGGPLPEHAEHEHGEDAGADVAGVLLDEGEAALAADVEQCRSR